MSRNRGYDRSSGTRSSRGQLSHDNPRQRHMMQLYGPDMVSDSSRIHRPGEQGDRFFRDDAAVERLDVGSGEINLPIRYYRTDCFLGVFSADLDAVAARLPSDRLKPVRLRSNRAAVGVIAYNYISTGVGPYGEIGIAPLCTSGGFAPPLLPALLETRNPHFGGFVLHVPVTSRIARDAGRFVWGYPKFVSDMDFDLQPEKRRVELSEGGAEILNLEVRHGGPIVRDRNPLVTFSEHGGDILRTEVASRAAYHVGVGRSAGHLELGTHPIAHELRDMNISYDTIATKSFVSHAAILPRGRVLTRADRPYEGYAGSEDEFGHHSVRYDDGVVTVISERPRTTVS